MAAWLFGTPSEFCLSPDVFSKSWSSAYSRLDLLPSTLGTCLPPGLSVTITHASLHLSPAFCLLMVLILDPGA